MSTTLEKFGLARPAMNPSAMAAAVARHQVSHHQLSLANPTLPYHITLNHIIAYHIIPYHTLPHHTIPYHHRQTDHCCNYCIRKPREITPSDLLAGNPTSLTFVYLVKHKFSL